MGYFLIGICMSLKRGDSFLLFVSSSGEEQPEARCGASRAHQTTSCLDRGDSPEGSVESYSVSILTTV